MLEEAENLGAKNDDNGVQELLNSLKMHFVLLAAIHAPVLVKGTKLEEAYETLKRADAIVMGSPVYFGSVSAQLKAFFDKTKKLRGEKAFCNKIACRVTVESNTADRKQP